MPVFSSEFRHGVGLLFRIQQDGVVRSFLSGDDQEWDSCFCDFFGDLGVGAFLRRVSVSDDSGECADGFQESCLGVRHIGTEEQFVLQAEHFDGVGEKSGKMADRKISVVAQISDAP